MYVIGTVVYWSPELKTEELGNSSKSDIWALWCILYEMCTGQWLREGYIDAAQQNSLKKLVGDTPHLRDFIEVFWRLRPIARPSIAELKESSTMRLMQIVVAGRDKDLTESRKLPY
jgi:serine/threonine protein kinase